MGKAKLKENQNKSWLERDIINKMRKTKIRETKVRGHQNGGRSEWRWMKINEDQIERRWKVEMKEDQSENRLKWGRSKWGNTKKIKGRSKCREVTTREDRSERRTKWREIKMKEYQGELRSKWRKTKTTEDQNVWFLLRDATLIRHKNSSFVINV